MSNYLVNRRRFSQLLTASGLALLASGCSTVGGLTYKRLPTVPTPKEPITRTPSIAEVLERSSEFARAEGEAALPDFGNKVLGINDFDGDPKGGPLLSNTFWRLILNDYQKGRLKVVDRSKIDAVIRELSQRDSKFSDLSPTEKTRQMGKLVNADYLWFGTVTEYHSQVQQVTLAEDFVSGEDTRYQKDYDDFKARIEANKDLLQKKIDDPTSAVLGTRYSYQNELSQLDQTLAKVKSLAEFKRDLKSNSTTANVTSVGITASIVSASDCSKVWVFDLSARGITLEGTDEMLIKTMMKSLFCRTPSLEAIKATT